MTLLIGSVASPQARLFRIGPWTVDPLGLTISQDTRSLRLERKVMQVLETLAFNAPRAATYQELMQRVWEGSVVGDDSLYRAIGMLRKALGDNSRRPIFIGSVPRIGYRLVSNVEWIEPNKSHQSQESAGPIKESGFLPTPFSLALSISSNSDNQDNFSRALNRHLGWNGGSFSVTRVIPAQSDFFCYQHFVDIEHASDQVTISNDLRFGPLGESVASWQYNEPTLSFLSMLDAVSEVLADRIIKEVRKHRRVVLEARPDQMVRTYWNNLLLADTYGSMESAHLDTRRRLLEEAIAAFSRLAPAWAAYADFRSWEIANGTVDSASHAKEQIRRSANNAIDLDPDNPYVLSRCGTAYSRIGMYESGVALNERAVIIAPSFANQELLSICLSFAGRAESAVEQLLGLLAKLPAGRAFQYGKLVVALTQAGRLEEALEFANRAVIHTPNDYFDWVLKANLEAHLGSRDTANTSLREALRLYPRLSITRAVDGIDRTYGRTAAQRANLTGGLRRITNA